MHRTAPILTAPIFPKLLDNLVAILESLRPEEWDLPTPCPGWSVHDLAAHLLGDEIGQLSMGRDEFQGSMLSEDNWESLVAGLSDLNEQWVEAMRRVSPRLMIDLLESTGEQVNAYFQSLDPYSVGPVVSWAGPDPAPMWLHIAREYTERWHHQQQIREAVGRPLLKDREWFAPALATFVHGLPRAYSNVSAPVGTTIKVTVSGPSGSTWTVARADTGWVLHDGYIEGSAAKVIIDEIDAWKLLTKSIAREVVEPRVLIEGDRELGSYVLDTVSVIA